MKVNRFFYAIILLYLPFIANSQNNWTHYSIDNGLLENDISDVLIETNEKVWVATRSGVCVVNALHNSINTCHTVSTGSFISQDVKQLAYANNRVWAVTDNGITSFQDSAITHYSTLNQGIRSKDIRDLAVDTSGQLWIATPTGIAHFNDSIFVYDTTVSAYHIAIDDSNRIFIINRSFNIIFNNNGPLLTHQVFDGTSWTQPAVTGLSNSPVAISSIKLKQTNEGIAVLSKNFDGGYYNLSYPFQLDSVLLDWPEYSNNLNIPFRLNDLAVSSSQKWVLSNHSYGLFSGKSGILSPHILTPSYLQNAPSFNFPERIESNDTLVVVSSANGLYIGYASTEPPLTRERLNTNTIDASINGYGPLFYDFARQRSLFEMPKDSNQFGILLANFFVTAKRKGATQHTANFISPSALNYLPGPVNNSAGIEGKWMFRISKKDIEDHLFNINNLRNYTPPDNIKNWQVSTEGKFGMAKDLLPFFDADNNGCYEPLVGDHPIIKGDEAIYWINHIGKFEYHGLLYAFNDTTSMNNPINQTIFLDYTIINRDSASYDSAKVGFFVDFELGNPFDNYVGCDSLKNLFYAYNADLLDENGVRNGYASNPPALGVKFLSDSMTSFISYGSGFNAGSAPRSDEEVFQYLNATWRDGTPLKYGATGRSVLPGSPTNYAFTGNPLTQTGWTERSSGTNPPGDRTGLGATPYFKIEGKGRKTLSLAIGYGRKTNRTQVGENIPEMIRVLENAQLVWDSLQLYSSSTVIDTSCLLVTGVNEVPDKSIQEDFLLYPNPTRAKLYIKIQNPSLIDYPIEIYTSEGKILQRQMPNNSETMVLNTTTFKKGLYIVRIGPSSKKLLVAD